MVDLFHNLYLGCLTCAGVCLFVSIVLFIRLDIREAFGVLTGRQVKKETRRLEKADFYIEREIMYIHTNEVVE
jgi:hypothetical protein